MTLSLVFSSQKINKTQNVYNYLFSTMSLHSISFLSLIITTQRKLLWVFLQQQLFTSFRETPIKTSFLSLYIFTFVLSTYQDDCRESDIGPHPVGNPLPLPPLPNPTQLNFFFRVQANKQSMSISNKHASSDSPKGVEKTFYSFLILSFSISIHSRFTINFLLDLSSCKTFFL